MGRFLTKSRVTTCAIIVFICSIYCLDTADSHGHSHDHEHSQEPPSLKYSQQANQPPADAHASHGHSHGDHGHDHGHSHGAHDHGHTHGGKSHDHAHSQQPRKTVTKNTGVTLWIEAITATAIISVSPIFILLFIQLDHTEQYQSRLKVLLSFASGGLLGDAFLHLIPHATSPHSHGGDDSHSHSHGHSHEEGHSHDMSVGLWTLAGIIAFLIVEKFVRYVKGGHSHSHAPPAVKEKKEEKSKASGDKADDNSQKKDGKKDKEVTDKKTDEVKTGNDCSEVEDIKVAGYLNLAADFAHNFTDGLAIGASFLMGQNIGIVTTITIFLHEIPHEIGDFAILVQSGCSKKKAMMLQFSTAIGAMLGTICSLFAEGIGEAATAWILPFTAGGFIYIATVSVIPELLEDSKPGQSVKEILALLVGVYMMVLIGQYE